MSDYEEQFRTWAVVIRELEVDLARLEGDDEALDGRLVSADWSPPTVGPLPAEFARTVVRLIDAQRSALARLAEKQRVSETNQEAASSAAGDAAALADLLKDRPATPE